MQRITHADPCVNGSCVRVGSAPTRSLADEAKNATSPLARANARLLALRAAHRQQEEQVAQAQVPTDAPQLPAHLGWGSSQLAQFIHRPSVQDTKPHDLRIVRQEARTNSAKQPANFVKAHPSLLIGMLHNEVVAAGRIWLLCRHLDQQGRGWLEIKTLREQLASKGAPLRIGGWRRLRQILREGGDVFWQRDGHKRLWLNGVAKVARKLDVTQLQGRPIQLPLSALTGSIATTRAHFYGSWHSKRKGDGYANPVSRETLTTLTSVSERTQRRYDERLNIVKRRTFALGSHSHRSGSIESTENTDLHWQRNNTTFIYTDHRGQHGKHGQHYWAWHLPNQYQGCHQHAPRGRQRKINRRLAATLNPDLVEKRAQGNEVEQKIERVFFVSGRAAIKAKQAQNEQDAYWHKQDNIQSALVWYVV